MSQFKVIEESEGAWLRMHKNEVSLDGKRSFEDPVKFRGGAYAPTGWLVAISGDRLEGGEDQPTRYEKGFFGICHDDNYPKEVDAWCFRLLIQDPGGTEDATMRERLVVTSDHVEVNGVRLTPGGGSGPSDTMWAPSGKTFTQQQDDGNFVTYSTPVPFSKSVPGIKPLWSAWTGKIG